uniref:Reverse transcriptase domain-containing protein n=2 Tax=Caenorhabditis tropicalis TaxID=1561998 RepID=A0A1I7T385_9PELO
MILFSVFLIVSMVSLSYESPIPQIGGLGNSMQPEVHATGLIPMITGTNVPESEEEIDAPIYDQNEANKIIGLAKQTSENGKNPEKAIPGFIESNPGFMSTVETLRSNEKEETTTTSSSEILTTPRLAFTLSNGIPTVSSQKTTVKS